MRRHAGGAFEGVGEVFARLETRGFCDIFDGHVGVGEELLGPLDVDAPYLGGGAAAQRFLKPPLEAAARHGNGPQDVADLNGFSGAIPDVGHCLGEAPVVYCEGIRGLADDDA
jgi:hypothetical protein